MKTLQHINAQWKKAVLLSALTSAPTLSVTTQAQAAPSRSNPTPTWNNQRSDNNRNNNRNTPQNQHSNGYNQNYHPAPVQREDHRFNSDRFDNNRYNTQNNRRDDRRNNGKEQGTSTTKLLGAGLIGAILGAVIAR
jgi:hypothetical protein